MNPETRLIIIAVALIACVSTGISVAVQGVLHNATVTEIREGDGHVASFVGRQHDAMGLPAH